MQFAYILIQQNCINLKIIEMSNRKTVGLILSGIGAIFYLIGGFSCISMSVYFGSLIIPYFIIGVIVIIGMIIGLKIINLGGAIVLIAIPIAFFVVLISTRLDQYYFDVGMTIIFLFVQGSPIPYFPVSAFIIIGGILCVLSTEKK